MKQLIVAGTLLAFLSASALPVAAAPQETQSTTKEKKKKKEKVKKTKTDKGAPQSAAQK